ncbi:transaldolase [Mucilaginibacter galii]|uniref:Transaldolase n=1 Tax=Mucilaginibacter galii TaxID=2005073 RepID=A0A917N3K7_9SPHI|nr:transaldolase [Mucilaginibacter galii]GGI52639.1 hypothetical protein GCM10011425_38510 [Mucilaginibacter galii]
MKNPLAQIPDYGQSIWLDYIRRNFISSGELKAMIDNDDLRGVTSNPAIFEEAIAHSDDYTEAIAQLAKKGLSSEEIFLNIAVEDVRAAADVFKEVYEKTHGLDGYVSLEVSPDLALNTEGTTKEALSSWKLLDRKNVMIKIPGTKEGLHSIKNAISEGININVTLLFGLERYREVAEAYVAGLEERTEKGLPIEGIASVASFFLSRIDTMVDPLLEKICEEDNSRSVVARQLIGKVAISSARVAYHIYKEVFQSDRFKALEAKGAKPQRLLWASTGVKNKAYSDVMYIEALIGPNTVNTVPKDTLDAFRDHGKAADRLEGGIEEAQWVLYQLEDVVGINLTDISAKLEEEGIQKFIKPFTSLMGVLEEKRQEGKVS